MNKKRKCIVTLIAGIMLAALYVVIFLFSGQDGETSGTISFSFSRYGVEFWNKLTGGHLTQTALNEMAVYFEHPLRKAAHFMEYALMGILTYSILCCHVKEKKRYFLAVLWVFLSASADELHQYFIPGRWASAADVVLDTAGGMAGAFFCSYCIRFAGTIRKRKKEKNNENKDT